MKLLLCSMQVKEWFLCSLQISTILIFHYLVDIYVVISSAKEAYKIKKWLYYMRFFIHVRAAHNPKVVSSNLAPATRNSYLKDNCEQEKHVVSVLYRGCVLFYWCFRIIWNGSFFKKIEFDPNLTPKHQKKNGAGYFVLFHSFFLQIDHYYKLTLLQNNFIHWCGCRWIHGN